MTVATERRAKVQTEIDARLLEGRDLWDLTIAVNLLGCDTFESAKHEWLQAIAPWLPSAGIAASIIAEEMRAALTVDQFNFCLNELYEEADLHRVLINVTPTAIFLSNPKEF